MRRVCGKLRRLPLSAWQAARRRPALACLVGLLVLAALSVGAWQYGLAKWRAAELAVKQGRPGDAREKLKVCFFLWPRSPQVHVLAGRVERMLGDFPAAEAHLNRALELDGRETDAVTAAVRLEFALMRVQSRDLDTLGTALFNAAQPDNPEAPMILETLSRAYLNRMRYKLAHGTLSRWIEIERDNPTPYQLRGWALERLNNPPAAKLDYERALELNPDFLAVRLRVAEMHLADKQAPEALPHLERMMRQAPDDPRVQARMGMCLFLQGRGPEARRLMEAAEPHLKQDAPLLIALANLDIQDGRGADAERRLRRVIEFDPGDTEALFVLAGALRLQERPKEAAEVLAEHARVKGIIERLNAMIKDVADSPTARPADHAEMGELFLQIGQEQVGVYWLDRALEKDPQNQRAHRALAAYYEKKGDAAAGDHHRRQLHDPAP